MTRVWLLSLAVGTIVAAQPAEAVPISLQIDPALTSLTLGVSTSVGADATALDLSGDVPADVLLSSHPSFRLVATQLELQGGSLTASHAPLSILAAGISLTFSSSNLGVSLTGPPASGVPLAPGFSLADFHDHVASLNLGSLSVLGNVFADPVDATLDLSLFPLELLLPLNSIGQIVVSEPAPGSMQVAISIPVDTFSQLFVSDLVIDVTLSGTLALTGTIIPEPGTGVLLGTGLTLLSAARRRRPSG